MDAAENTPLLQRKQRKRNPLPWFQISVVLLVQFAEPIASQSIYPYINQLISELDIVGGDERKVGYYAGLIESLFFAVQALTVLQWSRLSDRIGRKPVLLTGLFGLSISMLSFGLSRTFPMLIVSRCLCGLLNGNIGVSKSTLSELSDSTNRAAVYAWMPIVWGLGSTFGPLLGGFLAKPAERFPGTFGSQFWKAYPYFLPCLASSVIVLFFTLLVLVFFKETMRKAPYQSLSGSTEQRAEDQPITIRHLLVYPVILSVANYMCLALLDICILALVPLFFSMPLEIGGLGFKPVTIGYALGYFGAFTGIFQVLFFAKFVRYLGEKRMFVNGIISLALVFPVLALASYLAQREEGVTMPVRMCIATLPLLMINSEMAFGCITVYVNASSPTKRSLGATHGLAQTVSSIARAVGPAMATSLFSLSVEQNLLGGYAVYLALFILSCFGVAFALRLPDEVWPEAEE